MPAKLGEGKKQSFFPQAVLKKQRNEALAAALELSICKSFVV